MPGGSGAAGAVKDIGDEDLLPATTTRASNLCILEYEQGDPEQARHWPQQAITCLESTGGRNARGAVHYLSTTATGHRGSVQRRAHAVVQTTHRSESPVAELEA